MATAGLHVLIIDDDADTRANLRDILELDDHHTSSAGSAADALSRADWASYDAILLDRRLPDGTAEELLPRLRKLAPRAAVLVVTGYADLQGAIAALRQGAADYILKPINADALRASLARVAERQRAAAEIERLNKDLQHRVTELQTLLDVIPVGIAIAHDPSCRFISVNPAFARILQLPPGANASLNVPPEQRPPFQICREGRQLTAEENPVQFAATHGIEVRDVEVDVVQSDGKTFNLLGSAVPLRDEKGQLRGAIGAFLDITERNRSQERLLQSERLAAIGQMVAGLAHESGNALARSRSCLDLLQWEVEDRPEARELIARARAAQDHLQQLYQDVRGYAGPLKLEREVWDLSGIWRQAWENLAPARQGRQATLREEIDGVNLECSVDQFRLEQVFRNILENALAACVDPVAITVRASPSKLAGKDAVCLRFRDNGPGLTPEQRRRIFEPFFTTKSKGTGLGMAIARRIMEAHSGEITVGEQDGPGAEIVLTLPRDTD
jgi:signal transduction histidine kinase/FixJ family two-component response regulator